MNIHHRNAILFGYRYRVKTSESAIKVGAIASSVVIFVALPLPMHLSRIVHRVWYTHSLGLYRVHHTVARNTPRAQGRNESSRALDPRSPFSFSFSFIAPLPLSLPLSLCKRAPGPRRESSRSSKHSSPSISPANLLNYELNVRNAMASSVDRQPLRSKECPPPPHTSDQNTIRNA